MGIFGALAVEPFSAEPVAWVWMQRAEQVAGQDWVFGPVVNLLVAQAALVSSVRPVALRPVFAFAAGVLLDSELLASELPVGLPGQ